MKLLNEELPDAQRIKRVLQTAIDHYPRLAAFQFSLPQAAVDATFLKEETARYIRDHPARAYTEGPASLLAFQTDVEHRFCDHALARIAAGNPSPPTLLCWMWETGNALPCQMLLLFNLATFHHLRKGAGSVEEELKVVASLLGEAWNDVWPENELTGMKFFLIERTRPEVFAVQYAALREAMLQLVFPVSTRHCSLTS